MFANNYQIIIGRSAFVKHLLLFTIQYNTNILLALNIYNAFRQIHKASSIYSMNIFTRSNICMGSTRNKIYQSHNMTL